jgi:hypothetical protein
VNIRGVGRTVLTLGLVLGAAACDDNPTSEGRDQGDFMYVNPVNAAVEAGDTTVVIATVMNQYGTPTNEAVTAEPCDGKVTAVADPRRSEFESPETFLVMGHTLGTSCVVVRGGGLVDTAVVRVVPRSLVVSATDTTQVSSGETVAVGPPVFYDVTGAPVTGFTGANLTYSSLDQTIAVVDATGNATGRAPGVARIVGALTGYGVARADTVYVQVSAGIFSGTVTPSSTHAGDVVTIVAGAVDFDTDTQVTIDGVATLVDRQNADTILTAIPGLAPGTYTGVISNMGPDQLAVTFEFEITSSDDPTFEPENDDLPDAPVIADATNVFGTVSADDFDDFWQFTVAADGMYSVNLRWIGDADIDIYWFKDGAFTSFGGTYPCASSGNPETCTVSLTTGVWHAVVEVYTADSELPSNAYRLKITRQ